MPEDKRKLMRLWTLEESKVHPTNKGSSTYYIVRHGQLAKVMEHLGDETLVRLYIIWYWTWLAPVLSRSITDTKKLNEYWERLDIGWKIREFRKFLRTYPEDSNMNEDAFREHCVKDLEHVTR